MNAKEIVRAWQEANPRVDHNLVQGSPEWQAFRATKFGASDAAAMLGISPYQTRNELLRQKFTGTGKEVSADLQRVFDKGHEAEALARPIVEGHIDAELYPVVCSRGDLSASCDGLTMDDAIAWEHKQYNADLFAAVSAGILPDHHMPQCQQALLITGAERLLFVCSDGTADNFASMWVEPDYEYQAKIIAGWRQFQVDLEAFKPVEAAPEAVGATPDAFPVLSVKLSGSVIASNLVTYEQEIIARIKAIKQDLVTDQDFADAEKMVKALKDGKEQMGLAIKQARAEVQDIDALFVAAERIAAEMDSKRLWLEKLVKARKDARRAEIVRYGRDAYDAHILSLNQRLGRAALATAYKTVPNPDFAAAISGKRNFQSMQDAVDALLANSKLEANAIADKVDANLKHYAAEAAGYEGLFRDLDALLFKPADDFQLVVKTRIADHKAAEQKRLDDERERIRKEEEDKARAKVEAEAKARADALVVPPQAATTPQAQPAPAPLPTGVSTSPRNVVSMARDSRPTDDQIIAALALHYRVHESKVIEWLLAMDLNAASKRMASEFDAA